MTISETNPIGIDGIAFVEFCAPTEAQLDHLGELFAALGFSRTRRHKRAAVELWQQSECLFLVNREPDTFSSRFAKEHGPSIPSMGWWVEDAHHAIEEAVRRGGKRWEGASMFPGTPAIEGIGGSLLYFVQKNARILEDRFVPDPKPRVVKDRGFLLVDHLTNNVPKGALATWRTFYREVLGFTDVRTFDIHGQKTGLVSYALRSPCGKFCIPINEGTESKSQIEEYLREYKGAGIQHLALLSKDLLTSLEGLSATGVETLDIDPDYYKTVFDRVPGVEEDRGAIARAQILVDGDPEGYLLQIFTKNLIGPIFFELIQRHNHLSFGEGNFGALFRSIERDQEKRGVL
ncbi:MAG: 4-hydroxyphenylpyruvate dioxygenase [Sandaracinus sp.]